MTRDKGHSVNTQHARAVHLHVSGKLKLSLVSVPGAHVFERRRPHFDARAPPAESNRSVISHKTLFGFMQRVYDTQFVRTPATISSAPALECEREGDEKRTAVGAHKDDNKRDAVRRY